MDPEQIEPRDAARAERFARALSVVGMFDSGHADISVEHDRELDDIYGCKSAGLQTEQPGLE